MQKLSLSDIETSIEFYKERIRDNNKIKARAFSTLAYVESVFKNDFSEALYFIKKAMDLHPNNIEIQYSYYQHLFAAGFLEKAEVYLNTFRDENPFHMASWNDHIVILKEKEYWEEIINLGIGMLQKTNVYPDVYPALGSAYMEKEEFENAVDIYLQGIEVQPLDDLYNGVLMAYSYLGKNDKAISIGRKALKHHPNNALLLTQFGSILINLGQYQEALSILEQPIKLDSNNYSLYHVKACAHAKLNQVEKTAEMIEKTLEIEPSQVDKFKIDPDLVSVINNPKIQLALSAQK